MKNKLILILAVLTLIICTFAGCRKLGSATESAVSNVTSKVESDTKNLGSEVTGIVSNVESKVASKVS